MKLYRIRNRPDLGTFRILPENRPHVVLEGVDGNPFMKGTIFGAESWQLEEVKDSDG